MTEEELRRVIEIYDMDICALKNVLNIIIAQRNNYKVKLDELKVYGKEAEKEIE